MMKAKLRILLSEWRKEIVIGTIVPILIGIATWAGYPVKTITPAETVDTLRALKDTIRAKDEELSTLRAIVAPDTIGTDEPLK